jgi:competence protein ComEA
LSKFKQHTKTIFNFSSGEQTAVLAMLVLLLLALLMSLFPAIITGKQKWDYQSFDASIRTYYAELRVRDSLEALQKREFDFMQPDKAAVEQKFNPFPFNPNMLPEADWKKMGMADHQIRMIKNYEQKGGKFYRKEDLKKIYSISDAEYQILEPYIVIPAVEKPLSTPVVKTEEVAFVEEEYELDITVELNTADVETLVQLPQIGQWFAERIIRYRDNLGGYRNIIQLLEVQRMDSARLAIIKPYIELDTTQTLTKSVNNDDFRALLSHPYISFDLTKLIVNHRERRGKINSWDELLGLPGADTLVQQKLQPYLDFN